MLNTNRIRLFVSLAVLAVALLGPSAPRSAARTALAVDSLDCWYNGYQDFYCVAVISGGTGVYTATWKPTPIASGWDSPTEPNMVGRCQGGERLATVVTLTVTDSGGALARDVTSVGC